MLQMSLEYQIICLIDVGAIFQDEEEVNVWMIDHRLFSKFLIVVYAPIVN